MKTRLHELAFFGGTKMFAKPVSTSNLVKPDIEAFLALLKPAVLSPSGEQALIQQLEQELAAFHQVPHCVAVCSGFWALVLAIKALAGGTENFAAQRMNRGIRQALAGKRVEEV